MSAADVTDHSRLLAGDMTLLTGDYRDLADDMCLLTRQSKRLVAENVALVREVAETRRRAFSSHESGGRGTKRAVGS